jgi:hypothetical protein
MSSKSNSQYDREVYMVEQGGELPEKIVEEIQQDAEEEIACAERLAREPDKGNEHNGLQDDSGGSEDEHRDGFPSRRHHPKYDSRCRTYRE